MPTLVFSNGFLFSRRQAPSKNTARLWALRIFFRQKVCTVSRRERLGSQPSATALARMQRHQTTRVSRHLALCVWDTRYRHASPANSRFLGLPPALLTTNMVKYLQQCGPHNQNAAHKHTVPQHAGAQPCGRHGRKQDFQRHQQR